MDGINFSENEAYGQVFKTVKNEAYGTLTGQVSSLDHEANYAMIHT